MCRDFFLNFYFLAAAKSLQSCPTLCDPMEPTRLPRPWDSPGKNTGVGCHFLLQCMKVKSESKVTQSCLTLAIPWTAAHQAPPSMGFSRQKHWSGVPLPSLGRLNSWVNPCPWVSTQPGHRVDPCLPPPSPSHHAACPAPPWPDTSPLQGTLSTGNQEGPTE